MDPELRLAPLQFTSTTDRVSTELRRLIISGALAPGQALNEKAVSDQLGVSRSPVREAFQRLVAERLLVSERNKSVTVNTFSDTDIEEIYDARIAIESHAARGIIAAGSTTIDSTAAQLEVALDNLRTQLDVGDRLAVAHADLAFHQQLVAAGGNTRLLAAYELLSAETLTCMAWLENVKPSGDELMQDHRDFIDALQAQDSDRISAVITQHLSRANLNLTASDPAERALPNVADAPID
ncbi:GntR family transcriptional regulator [Rudaeicoccus suwonensis]|uniref:DNA-binding GntR family transcriptional regulator n=1 Tax=Rudaeicoccus suwonensis TaxID=657409 RepID=A0A561E3U6_9MICO|nr:GntR family transcriptional regulator [Rudaeicoccus suwonensis]TWE10260.1 DNA-binding GntR family transcriptional regulator [Rudaeicoccus suwonensis]